MAEILRCSLNIRTLLSRYRRVNRPNTEKLKRSLISFNFPSFWYVSDESKTVRKNINEE